MMSFNEVVTKKALQPPKVENQSLQITLFGRQKSANHFTKRGNVPDEVASNAPVTVRPATETEPSVRPVWSC